jgi:hypothetical protein
MIERMKAISEGSRENVKVPSRRYVFGCTLMSKPSVHCGGTELFDIEK